MKPQTLALFALAIGVVLAIGCTPLPVLDDGSDEQPTSVNAPAPPAPTSTAPPPESEAPETVEVGPDGGHLVFRHGIVLDVPAGALSANVAISATLLGSVPSVSDLPASEFVTGVRLRPEGLAFSHPATLSISLPRSPANLSAFALGEVPRESDDDDSDPSLAQPETIISVTDGRAQLSIVHFSYHLLADAKCNYATTVREVRSCDEATVCTEPVSQQIMAMWQKLNPGVLSVMPPQAPPNSAFLHAAALKDLQAAAAIAPVRVNYAWRSLVTEVATQYCKKAAKVGGSSHGPGAAVDVETIGFDAAKKLCLEYRTKHPSASTLEVMDVVVPIVGRAMLANNWVWWGLFNASDKICSDPVHFEHRTMVGPHVPLEDLASLRRSEVKAFQTLWNANNPCRVIGGSATSPNGVLDTATTVALNDTPIRNFWSTIVTPLESAGMTGGGCPKDGNTNKTTCCPFKPPCGPVDATKPPACHDLKEELENCGACGNRCGAKQHCTNGQCVCEAGLVYCPKFMADGGDCLDPSTFSTDPEHCGGCNRCAASEKCVGGTCVTVCPCPVGEAVTDVPHKCSPVECNAYKNYRAYSCSGGRACCPDGLASGQSPYPACTQGYIRGFDGCFPTQYTAAWCHGPDDEDPDPPECEP